MQTIVNTFLIAVFLGLLIVAFGAAAGRLHPLVDIFGQFVLPAIVGGVVVALIAALTGRYATLGLLVAGVALLIALVWPSLQKPAGGPASGPRFTLMSFNVYFFNTNPSHTIALVRARKPDIVVFLEVIPPNRPGLAPLEADYPHRIECWQERPCDALILSRFPLTDIRATLPQVKHRRPLGAVAMEIEGRKLSLFAAHLSLPYPLDGRDRQPGEVEDIAAAVNSVSGARLMSGDFNASTWGGVMTELRARTGMTILTGVGATWPTFLPFHAGIPIDHVLASDDLALLSRDVVTIKGSDHRAVIAEVAFKN